MKEFRLVLTDDRTTMPLGTFQAKHIVDAEKQARKKYPGLFRRLTLPRWRIEEVSK